MGEPHQGSVSNELLSMQIDALTNKVDANAETSANDREEMKRSIREIFTVFDGTPGVPGMKIRVDRMEQAFLRSTKIQTWVLGIVGAVIAAQGITIINLIVAKLAKP